MAALAVLLAGLAVWLATGRSAATSRLHRLTPTAGRPAHRSAAASAHSPANRSGHTPAMTLDLTRPGIRALICALAAGGLAVLIGGLAGVVVGGVAALLGYRLLGGLETAAARQRSQQLTVALPMVATLLAACLRAGRPIEQSVAAVAAAVDGPMGEELTHVAAALSLGAPASTAWRRLLTERATSKTARTLVRAWESGAPLARALDAIGEQARADARALALQRAKAVGVQAAAPLGLCFLPAFIAVGLVPVVAGVVTNVLHQIL